MKKEKQLTIINTELLEKYLTENNETEPPNSLINYTKIIKLLKDNNDNIIGNIVVDLYNLTYIELQSKNNNTDKSNILIFTKNENTDKNSRYNSTEYRINKIIKGNIDYADDTILKQINDKVLCNTPKFKIIAKHKRITWKNGNKKYYINIKERSLYEGSLTDGADYKENDIKLIDKAVAQVSFENNIRAGIQLELKDGLYEIYFNMFDKKDVEFGNLKIDITEKELNKTIRYLQNLISNSNDLEGWCELEAYNYFNPFESSHRRIRLILYGGTGTGKTTMTNMLCDWKNKHKYCIYADKLKNWEYNKNYDFNPELQGASIIAQKELKHNDGSNNYIKLQGEANSLFVNEKNKPQFLMYFWGRFISSYNPVESKTPIENLIEGKDNRNWPI